VWGKSIFSTNKILHDNINEDIAVASIGPAGENLVKFACIMSSYYSAFGRGGAGAVMGSKKLKAVVIAGGKGRVRIAQPVRFKQTVEEAREAIYRDSKAERLYRYGTAGSIARMNQARLLPSYNFQRSHIDEIADLDSQSWEEKGYLRGRIGCTSCILSCHRFTSVATGSHAIKYSGGPEYEAISALGTGCGVNDFSAVHEANAICNDMGLDTISTGAVIQWAMETFQKGLLGKEAVDGIDMRFGSKAAITTLPRLIAMREGIGDLLAEGTKVAAQEIGGESWKWAVQARGLEQSRVETRGAYAYALSFAVNPRGPDHLHSECLAEFGATPEAQELIERITGSKKYAMPNMTEKRAEIVRWHEDIFAVSDSLGLCAFTTTSTYGLDESICARLFRYATGVDIGAPEIMLVGRRIVTLERCYNLTEGMRGLLDQLPWRIMNERQRDLFPDRAIVSGDMLQSMLTEYYKLHGWDSNGIPTKLALAQLGLLPLVEVRDETVR